MLEWHSEYNQPKTLAVNVKVYGPFYKTNSLLPFYSRLGYTLEEFSTLVEGIFEAKALIFWERTIQEIGQKYRFKEVFTEGRMGGWAIPSLEDGAITENKLTASLENNYLRFRDEVKSLVDNADALLYADLLRLWTFEERVFLREHSVSVRLLDAMRAA